MDVLTLTPAWGGVAQDALTSLRGDGMPEKSSGGNGVRVSGSGFGGGSTASSVPLAYWDKQRKRRTLSAQLVFPIQHPENTAEIVQPDPNLAGEYFFNVFSFSVLLGLEQKKRHLLQTKQPRLKPRVDVNIAIARPFFLFFILAR